MPPRTRRPPSRRTGVLWRALLLTYGLALVLHLGPALAPSFAYASTSRPAVPAPASGPEASAPQPVASAAVLGSFVDTLLAPFRALFGSHEASPPRPNIILIFTDDQRWDCVDGTHTPTGKDLMPQVRERLERSGVTFENAFLNSPLCCPSRATVLTGQYAHRHGVRTNDAPYGGVSVFHDSRTLATALQAAGYRTALIGKYLNRYENLSLPNDRFYVPPGWDVWQAFMLPGYFHYTLIENGAKVKYGTEAKDYSTDVLRDKAIAFIHDSVREHRPFFLFLNPRAPHLPATPAPRHEGVFENLPPWRPPSYNEADISDKPWFVRKRPLMNESARQRLDQQRILMLETLLAVDEAVGAIMDTLEREGIDDDTMVVYASDNGFMWGEHRLDKKRCPYEECIRTPLFIRYPRMIAAPRKETGFATNCDFMPTFLELAHGSTTLHMDGTSLVPLLEGHEETARHDTLIEGWQKGYVFAGVRGERWKYVEYLSGEVELYDLANDPYELTNVAGKAGNLELEKRMAARLRELRPHWPQDARAIGAYFLDSSD